jgi:hypothetical protein
MKEDKRDRHILLKLVNRMNEKVKREGRREREGGGYYKRL